MAPIMKGVRVNTKKYFKVALSFVIMVKKGGNDMQKTKLNNVIREKVQFEIKLIILLVFICLFFSAFHVEAATATWKTRSGKTYYYTQDGKKAIGLKKIKGKYYYFDKKGVLYKKGWKTIKGSKYYFSKKTGRANVGAAKVGSKRYLFSKSGKLYKYGLRQYGSKTYFVSRNGTLTYGWKSYKGKKYYFTKSGAADTGWFTYKSKKYYADKKGVVYTGKKKVGKYTYYFTSKGIRQTGWIKSGSKKYYADSSGRMVINAWKTISGKKYHFDKSGVMEKSKWINNTYYVGADGAMYKNKKVGSYYVGSDGKRIIEGWVTSSGNKKYRLLNGTYITNAWKTISGKQYHFDKNGVLEKNKWIGEKYVGSDGAWIPNYNKGEGNKPTQKSEIIYYETISKAIFKKINEFRVQNGMQPLQWAGTYGSQAARLRAGYNVYHYVTEKKTDFSALASHGTDCAIGYSSGLIPDNAYADKYAENVVDGWIDSPIHRGNLLSKFDDAIAIAVYTYSDYDKYGDEHIYTSVMGAFSLMKNDNAPITEKETSVPKNEWDMYLNCTVK